MATRTAALLFVFGLLLLALALPCAAVARRLSVRRMRFCRY